ncbi:hypothetical protein MCOR07_005253 [Pyricularia oryzae]|nr:hypothetical protein MCOR30_005690 [Pyricularia oryzae]KAI6413068.1 hypothetical protein MCOR20_003178 [Pyricularia oryzae]KAI6474607.1 hypothetical protein MCOR17_002045 [Pyricularia oryzae]KAI6606661.1 hypothetical protein MCOR12_000889 [Pyricularia oryzae]KAI6616981.1 hypothetical protein MCOR08_009404 [Pyricularia oryzae]
MLSEDYYDHPERYDRYRYIKMRKESHSRENRTHLVNIALAHMLLKYDWSWPRGLPK